MKWDFRGLLVLTVWIVLIASGVWASATGLGVSPMRGAWVAESMRAMVY
jgi:hypothetical protein